MSEKEMITKLTEMIKQQHDRLESEKKESIKREEKMQQLLDTALSKMPEVRNQGNKIPSNATPAPVLVHNASLREFTTWSHKFKDYMLLTGIDRDTNERQKAVLRSLLDDEWFRIARFALNIKMDDMGITVDAIIEQMLEHLRSQRNVVLDRKEFYSRNQQQDEKFDDYYVSLQEIAAFCDFCPECIDTQYRDRIVTGIRNDETIKDLLSEKGLTLEKAVSICRANENAINDTENLQATASGINRVVKYKNDQNRRADNGNRFPRMQPWRKKSYDEWKSKTQPEQRDTRERRNQQPQLSQWNNEGKLCRSCGYKWHDNVSQCPARSRDCAKCGQKGHFAKVCINSLSAEEDSESDEYEDGNTWRIIVAGVKETSLRKKSPKISVNATYHEKTIQIECTPDTGAEMTVIGIDGAQKLGANIDNLKPTKYKLYAADRKRLTCLGVIPVKLQLGDKATEVNMIVVSEVQRFLYLGTML